jgi:hypothetical protein
MDSYLMKKFGYTFDQSLNAVKSVRSIVNVNPNFVKQLLLYEKLHHVVDLHSSEYLKFKEQAEIDKKKNRSEIIYLHYTPLSLPQVQPKNEPTTAADTNTRNDVAECQHSTNSVQDKPSTSKTLHYRPKNITELESR